jgi:hypothetical protein
VGRPLRTLRLDGLSVHELLEYENLKSGVCGCESLDEGNVRRGLEM